MGDGLEGRVLCAGARPLGGLLEALDVDGTTRSPGLRRMMARAGSESTPKEGRDDLKVYARIRGSAKDRDRVAEGIGH